MCIRDRIIAAGEHCYLDYPQLPGQNNRGWMLTYEVQDVYGTFLFLTGLAGALAICLIAVFLHRDGIFYSYRVAMLVLCLGCLFTPFMSDNNTYSSALIFSGYHLSLIHI